MKNKALSIAFLAAIVVCLIGSSAYAFPGPMPYRPSLNVEHNASVAELGCFGMFGAITFVFTMMVMITENNRAANCASVVRASEALVATQQEAQRQMAEILGKLETLEARAKAADEERRALIETLFGIARTRLEAIAKLNGKNADEERQRLVHELITLVPDLTGDEIDQLLTPKPTAQA